MSASAVVIHYEEALYQVYHLYLYIVICPGKRGPSMFLKQKLSPFE